MFFGVLTAFSLITFSLGVPYGMTVTNMLEFKPDADKAFQRLEAWWRGEMLDRVHLAVVAPKTGVLPKAIPAPATLEEQWTNLDYVIESQTARLAATAYMACCSDRGAVFVFRFRDSDRVN